MTRPCQEPLLLLSPSLQPAPDRPEQSQPVRGPQAGLVRTLVSGTREAGTYRASLGGLSAGVYFLNLQAGTYRATKSLVVVR